MLRKRNCLESRIVIDIHAVLACCHGSLLPLARVLFRLEILSISLLNLHYQVRAWNNKKERGQTVTYRLIYILLYRALYAFQCMPFG